MDPLLNDAINIAMLRALPLGSILASAAAVAIKRYDRIDEPSFTGTGKSEANA